MDGIGRMPWWQKIILCILMVPVILVHWISQPFLRLKMWWRARQSQQRQEDADRE